MSIQQLVNNIHSIYMATKKPISNNVWRGHSRSISADIEDQIALMIADSLPNGYELYLDPSVTINGRLHRPDLIIVDPNKNVSAIIEIKANMGWCRDASNVINNMVALNQSFCNAGRLTVRTLSKVDTVTYSNTVKMFLISLTDNNCGDSAYSNNQAIANKNNIKHYCLFTGWYDNLIEKDVGLFLKDIT